MLARYAVIVCLSVRLSICPSVTKVGVVVTRLSRRVWKAELTIIRIADIKNCNS